ncbi:MAG: MmcQ/YjbR family DNA-binding protein [Thermoanaerobaculales bacterium]|jgi:predicted DNA-binding protein (MmcQ/YjbR family)|nr:MmcQ/YjbR family DNA-binding protein [Thermoanaerobaculales bacterium]
MATRKRRPKLEAFKALLLERPGATEDAAFGPEHLSYKVGGKLFAVLSWDEEPMRVALKCDPVKVEVLRKVFPAVRPAPYFNKQHWNLVILDGSVPGAELEAMIDESYALVVKGLTRKQREAIPVRKNT